MDEGVGLVWCCTSGALPSCMSTSPLGTPFSAILREVVLVLFDVLEAVSLRLENAPRREAKMPRAAERSTSCLVNFLSNLHH